MAFREGASEGRRDSLPRMARLPALQLAGIAVLLLIHQQMAEVEEMSVHLADGDSSSYDPSESARFQTAEASVEEQLSGRDHEELNDRDEDRKVKKMNTTASACLNASTNGNSTVDCFVEHHMALIEKHADEMFKEMMPNSPVEKSLENATLDFVRSDPFSTVERTLRNFDHFNKTNLTKAAFNESKADQTLDTLQKLKSMVLPEADQFPQPKENKAQQLDDVSELNDP